MFLIIFDEIMVLIYRLHSKIQSLDVSPNGFVSLEHCRIVWNMQANMNLMEGTKTLLLYTRSSLIHCRRFLSQTFDPKKDYYSILNVTPKATHKQIKAAYYKLSKELHPDLNPGRSSAKFSLVAEAYKILGDVDERKVYDRNRIVHGSKQMMRHTPYSQQEIRMHQQSAGFAAAANYDSKMKMHYEESLKARRKAILADRLRHPMTTETKDELSKRYMVVLAFMLFTGAGFGIAEWFRERKNAKYS